MHGELAAVLGIRSEVNGGSRLHTDLIMAGHKVRVEVCL